MIPFSIDLWRAGKKVVTRDGREVTQLHLFDVPKDLWRLYGVVDGVLQCFRTDGKGGFNGGESCLDLFHPAEEMYVNVYEDGWVSNVHISFDEAKHNEIKGRAFTTYKLVKP